MGNMLSIVVDLFLSEPLTSTGPRTGQRLGRGRLARRLYARCWGCYLLPQLDHRTAGIPVRRVYVLGIHVPQPDQHGLHPNTNKPNRHEDLSRWIALSPVPMTIVLFMLSSIGTGAANGMLP